MWKEEPEGIARISIYPSAAGWAIELWVFSPLIERYDKSTPTLLFERRGLYPDYNPGYSNTSTAALSTSMTGIDLSTVYWAIELWVFSPFDYQQKNIVDPVP